MTPDREKAIEDASESECIYEPKYGGKDHSGYDTMMKYEINGERQDAFINGAKWAFTQADAEFKMKQNDWLEACQEIDVKDKFVEELVSALEQWNNSCHPHPKDHVAMFAAKQNAENVLQKAQKARGNK